MTTDPLREAASALLKWAGEDGDGGGCQVCGGYDVEGHATGCEVAALRAALAAPSIDVDYPCPGCEVCVGEIDDCGCVIGHRHTCEATEPAKYQTDADWSLAAARSILTREATEPAKGKP